MCVQLQNFCHPGTVYGALVHRFVHFLLYHKVLSTLSLLLIINNYIMHEDIYIYIFSLDTVFEVKNKDLKN